MNTLLPAQLERPCIPWPDAISSEGYGRFRDKFYAHRMAWEEASGEPIPDGLQIDHLCHAAAGCTMTGKDCLHRRCVNTDHLEVVTMAENIRRGNSPWAVNARKTHCIRGHEFTPDNTIIHGGTRECRTCTQAAMSRWNEKLKATRGRWGEAKAARTHCKNGHEWTPENTSRATVAGNRRCLACHREDAARRRMTRKGQA